MNEKIIFLLLSLASGYAVGIKAMSAEDSETTAIDGYTFYESKQLPQGVSKAFQSESLQQKPKQKLTPNLMDLNPANILPDNQRRNRVKKMFGKDWLTD